MRLLYGLFLTLLMQTAIFASTTIQNSYSYDELNKLTASDAASSDEFGRSVAISGDYAIIGAYGDQDNGSQSGSAYIFKNDGSGNFTQSSKLIASDAAVEDIFGYSVAISGDYAIIGAWGNDDNGSMSGSAYIFKNDGSGNFTQSSKLIASDAVASDYFGWSVAISGDYAIVGAYGDDDSGSQSGSAYIFHNNGDGNFTQSSKLKASDGSTEDYFGYSVAISGDYAIIGAYGDNDNGPESGSAYIFKNDGSGIFTQSSRLIASDAATDDYFGYSVAINGDYAIVGACRDNDNGSESGSAYIFKNDGSGNFTHSAKLIASDGAAEDFFGKSVAISGDYAIIGAPYDGNNGSRLGSAYIFKNDGSGNFTQNSKLIASDAAVYDYFGQSVAISGNYLIIGAYGDDDNGPESGSAYIFNATIKTDAIENSTTFSLDIDATEATDYAISGTDSSLFDINTTSGEITFKAAPDYENPADADTNNEYQLSVTANGTSNSDTKSVKITVTDSPAIIQNSYSYDELEKLIASDAAAEEWFGWSAAISGDYAIIGAYGDDDNGTDSGSAYIFKNDGSGNFTQSSKLIASDGAVEDYFGYSVAISGDYAIIGAPYDDDNGSKSGSAYIFKNDGSGNFTQSSKLIASDGAAGDEFGISVAISSDHAIVGAHKNADNGSYSGSAYIFKNDGSGNFTQSSKLIASDTAANDSFGVSVAISGDYAIIGAYGDTDNGFGSGSAYIFKNDGSGNFIQNLSKLLASDGVAYDLFGYSVAISGDYAIVGAYHDNDDGIYSGSAYIFKNDGSGIFTQSSKLRASDGAVNDQFGSSVAISGNVVIVGAYYDDDNGADSGSAYIFKNDGSGSFTQSSKLTASDGATSDNFGQSVAISGEYAIVGAPWNDDNGSNSGSAYIFNDIVKTNTPENNTTFSLDIDATETLDYSISGVDSALFNIDTATGEITFKSAPDYENPLDADTNNEYELSVTANGSSNSDTKTVKIEVTNVDDDAPTGYSVEFDLSDINASQTDSTSFTFTNAEDGSTYDYSVSSSRGGGTVTGSGTVTSANQTFLIDDLSGLFDGTLTVSVTLTDSANNEGATVTHTTTLNAVTEGIEVSVSDDTTSEADSDNSALFSVTLMSEPEHEVTITLASTNTAEGNVTIPVTKLLTFISGNWDVEQNVTVVGVDDSQKDGDIAYSIDLNTSSSDSEYDGKSTQVNLTNSDDEAVVNPAVIMYLLD